MEGKAVFDRVTGLLFMGLGLGAILHAQNLMVAFSADPVGPRPFPTIVGAILTVAGAFMALRPERIGWHKGKWAHVATAVVASLIYPLLLHPLGFVIATSLLLVVLAMILGARWLPGILSAVITSAVIFMLIDLALGLPLPRGPLGF